MTLIIGAILAYFSIYYTCFLYASNILVDREFLLGEGTIYVTFNNWKIEFLSISYAITSTNQFLSSALTEGMQDKEKIFCLMHILVASSYKSLPKLTTESSHGYLPLIP